MVKKGAESAVVATTKPEPPVSVVTAEQQASAAGAKKKKKRRNKKKAGASTAAVNGAGEGDASDDSDVEYSPKAVTTKRTNGATADEEGSNLGPHALLVSACVKEGFRPDQVNAAIAWLFENNREYDTVDAIVRHLRGEDKSTPVPSPITSFPSADIKEAVPDVVVSPSLMDVSSPESPAEEEPVFVPLETRLEMAVSHEDLEASMGALTAFIVLAKEEQQWDEQRKPLFSSKALELLLTNLLTQSLAHPSEYPAKLHDSLELLLRQLLGTSAALQELLQVIQHTQKLNHRSPLSTVALQGIAEAVSATLREHGLRVDSNGAAELPQLESRLANSPARDRKTWSSPKELFLLRESRVEKVGDYKKACGILLSSLSPSSFSSSVDNSTPMFESLLETLLKDSLQVSSEGLKEKRSQIDRLRAEMSSVHSAMEVDLQPLRVDVAGCKNQLEELRSRRDTLLRELGAVNSEIAGVEARQERLEGLIGDRIQSYEDAHSKRDQRLKGMLSIMHRADEAEAIAKNVTAIEKRLSRDLTQKQVGKTEDMEGRLLARLPGFIDALDAYLEVEVKCYEFLKDRSERLDGEVVQIAKSISQFQASGLGMKDSLLVLSEQKALKEAHSDEDKAAVSNLRDHAANMYHVARAAIERFKLLPLAVDKTVLARIKQNLNIMGLGKDWVLDDGSDPLHFIPQAASSAVPPIQQQPVQAIKKSPNPNAGFFPVPTMSLPVAPPAPLPVNNGPAIKMSWASRVASSHPIATKSLTEIQAEEEELQNLNKRSEQQQGEEENNELDDLQQQTLVSTLHRQE